MSCLAAQVDQDACKWEIKATALCTHALRPNLYLDILHRSGQAFQGCG